MPTPNDYSSAIYSAMIADRIMAEPHPKITALALANAYSLRGKPASSLKLNRFGSIGFADTVPANTEYTTVTPISTSGVTATTSRQAKQCHITVDDIMSRVPGMDDPRRNPDALLQRSPEEIARAIFPEVAMLIRSEWATAELMSNEMFTGFSRSVGTGGSAAVVEDIIDGVYEMDDGEDLPHGDIVACAHKAAYYDIANDFRGEQAAAFAGSLGQILQIKPDLPRTNLRAAPFGVPLYVVDSSVAQYANGTTDRVGAFFLRGYGDPEVSGIGQHGAICFVEKAALHVALSYEQRAFAYLATVDWPFGLVERADNFGVKWVSRASR